MVNINMVAAPANPAPQVAVAEVVDRHLLTPMSKGCMTRRASRASEQFPDEEPCEQQKMFKTNTLTSIVAPQNQDAATTTAHAFFKASMHPSPILNKLQRDHPNRNFGSISGMSSRLNSFAAPTSIFAQTVE